jgi:hypothetical protein
MKRPAAFSVAWWQEWGLTAMLVSLVLALFVASPLAATGVVGAVLFDVLFAGVLVSGVVAFSRRRMLAVCVALATFATFTLRWLGHGAVSVWNDALSIVALTILTGLVLEHVFRAGPITGDRVRGAVLAYLLIGLVWTFAYQIAHRLAPGSFRFTETGVTPEVFMHGLGYFSFVTLTTLGYGDITPLHPVARSLAVAEALVGQLYPAILIGRLVSLQISARDRD